MKENRKYFISSIILFIVFVIFTILVKNVDVQAVGPQDSVIGLASINKPVSDHLPYNGTIFRASEILGYYVICTVCIFALFGVMQLVIKKGFKNVDKDLYVLAGLYLGILFSYIFFEFVIINYRPITVMDVLDASYPSSHTLMAVAFIPAAIQQFRMRLKKEKTKKIVVTICAIIGIGLVITRFLSGVHWLTDIIGAILLASAWVMLYIACVKTMYKDKVNNENA